MKFIIASDHIGYPLKQAVIEYLETKGETVFDAGPDTPNVSIDYPDYAHKINRAVTSGEYDQGILICGTGLGMSIAANKHPGIRAALCHDVYTAHLARAHNDANVLCLGAWVVSPQRTEGILDEWLKTTFEEGRHTTRLAKLDVSFNGQQQTLISLEDFQFGVALSPRETSFGPLLFMGQLERGMAAVAEAGFDAVELSLRTSQDVTASELEALLDQHGLGLSAVATGQSCLHDFLCLADPDSQVREAAVERLKSLILFASRFGTPAIIGGIRGSFSGSPETYAQQMEGAIEAVQECAGFAAEQNTSLLIEPINRYETNFINNAQEGLRFLEEVGEPNVKLLLDTFHMNIEEQDMHASLREAGDCLGYIHFADSNREALGRGHIDFTSILQTLASIGYKGIITAEILPIPDDLTAIQQTADFVKSLIER